MANIKDFAAGLVLTAPSPATTGTSVTLRTGEGALMPAVPFYATLAPAGQLTNSLNSEKVLVTARPGNADTFTITRAQGGTAAKPVAAGWAFVNAVYADDLFNSALVFNEVPVGTIDGTNVTFTTASTPTASNVRVHLNGLRLKVTDDYTVSGNTITFVTAPTTGSNLLVDYVVGSQANSVGTNSYIAKEAVTGSINGSNTVFTTARAYVAGSLEVYVNGLKQGTAHVTETTPSSGTFTLDTAPATGDIVEVAYQYNLNPSGNADTVDGIHASTTPTANQLMPLNAAALLDPRALNFNASQVITGGGISTTSTSYVDVTGMSTTVTIPTGVTKLAVFGSIRMQSQAAGTTDMFARVVVGSVNTMDTVQTATNTYEGGTAAIHDVITVTPGTYTAKVQFRVSAAITCNVSGSYTKVFLIPIGG